MSFKVYSVCVVLSLSLTAAFWPQHGQTGPRPGQGGATGPGLTPVPGGEEEVASVYDDATAIWTFNEPNDLGFEGNDTLVGNSTYFDGVNQYASVADNASFSHTAKYVGYCYWTRPDGLTTGDRNLAKTDGVNNEFTMLGDATPTFYFYGTGGAGFVSVSLGSVLSPGTRTFLCSWYNPSDTKAYATANGAAPTAGSDTMTSMSDTSAPFTVGAEGDPANYTEGDIGPVLYYIGDAAPPYESLYNSGKGKLCEDLTAAEKVGLVSCWDMDEDGGPYVDSIGSNNLTGQNSPTQSPGMTITGDGDPDLYLTAVNTPTSTGGALGYAAEFDGTDQYATGSDPFNSSNPFTVSCWVRENNFGAADGWMGQTAGFGFGYGASATAFRGFVYDAGSATLTPNVTIADKERFQAWMWTDATKVYAAKNDDAAVSAAFDTAVDDTANDLTIALFAGAYTDGTIGPCYIWNAQVSSANRTSIYNSGKGKLCGDLTDTEKTNMIHCWDMTENGGPYADSIGSNNLTAANTPTRAAGLVERSDSGMSGYFSRAGESYLYRANTAALNITQDFTIAVWINKSIPIASSLNAVAGTQSGTAAGWSLKMDSTEKLRWDIYGSDDGLAYEITGTTTGEWYLAIADYDYSTKTLTLLMNNGNFGALRTDTISANPTVGSANFNIGWDNVYQKWDGGIDNLAIWQRLLTSDEKTALWNAGAGDFYTAYWDAYFSGDPIRFAWSAMPEIRRMD